MESLELDLQPENQPENMYFDLQLCTPYILYFFVILHIPFDTTA
jgi:hypothetical protein